MTISPGDILARYGNWYHGADDEFAHCFILRDGHCVLLLQGLQTVKMQRVKAPEHEHQHLAELLEQPIPAQWASASYAGFNFVTDPEGLYGIEIAVYGVQPSDTRPPGEYYAAPADSPIGQLVKAIAQVD